MSRTMSIVLLCALTWTAAAKADDVKTLTVAVKAGKEEDKQRAVRMAASRVVDEVLEAEKAQEGLGAKREELVDHVVAKLVVSVKAKPRKRDNPEGPQIVTVSIDVAGVRREVGRRLGGGGPAPVEASALPFNPFATAAPGDWLVLRHEERLESGGTRATLESWEVERIEGETVHVLHERRRAAGLETHRLKFSTVTAPSVAALLGLDPRNVTGVTARAHKARVGPTNAPTELEGHRVELSLPDGGRVALVVCPVLKAVAIATIETKASRAQLAGHGSKGTVAWGVSRDALRVEPPIEARVTTVRGTTIELSAGLHDKVEEGFRFTIRRAGDKIATVVVDEVGSEVSEAHVEKLLAPGGAVQKGDEASTSP